MSARLPAVPSVTMTTAQQISKVTGNAKTQNNFETMCQNKGQTWEMGKKRKRLREIYK